MDSSQVKSQSAERAAAAAAESAAAYRKYVAAPTSTPSPRVPSNAERAAAAAAESAAAYRKYVAAPAAQPASASTPLPHAVTQTQQLASVRSSVEQTPPAQSGGGLLRSPLVGGLVGGLLGSLLGSLIKTLFCRK